MKIHLTKAFPEIKVRVEVAKTEPTEVRLGVVSGAGHWRQYSAQHWERSETETHYILEHALQGVWAADAVFFWLERLSFDIGFNVKWAETNGEGDFDEDNCNYADIAYAVDGVVMESLAALEAALSAGDQWHDLGNVKLESGTVRVTDPCYDKSAWCTRTFKAVEGLWVAQCLTGPTDWHHRVKALRIRHASVGNDVFSDLARFDDIGYAGVDSGQLGFFDDGRYPTQANAFKYEKGVFYGDCCKLTSDMSRPGGGVIEEEFGVLTASGYGDGSYPVLVRKNEQGVAIAAIIEYICEDEDEQAED